MDFLNAQYSGDENCGRMEGKECTFSYLSEGVTYEGEMKDGMFHGKGTITFSSGAKMEGLWSMGQLIEKTYIYKDGLQFNEDVDRWMYCKIDPNSSEQDRRFYKEMVQANNFGNQSVLPKVQHACISQDGVQPAIPKKM